jgi:hypothetical protein
MTNFSKILNGAIIDNTSLSRDLVYVPELSLVFCFISKNASSFLKAYIASLARGVNFDWAKRNPHVLKNSGFLSLCDLSETEASEILMSSDVARVVVGRDPVSRFRSAYLTRVVTFQREAYDSHNRSSWLRLRQRILAHRYNAHAVPDELAMIEDISIDDVADYVSRTPSGLLDQHFTPQTYFSSVQLISYDLVGTVENLDSFISELCEIVKRKPLEIQPPPLNRLMNSGADAELSQVSSELLISRYKADYEFFDYQHI